MATERPRRHVLAIYASPKSSSSHGSSSRPRAVESRRDPLPEPQEDDLSTLAATAPGAETGARTGPPLILVIDDNPDLRDLYCEALEEESFRVVPWPAPPAEPAYVATLAPDLVILDLLIDHADLGWQFLELLKTDPATAVVPVLVCAGDVALLERVADRLPTWTCGALRKPFDLEQFLGTVRMCLGETPRPEPD